MTTETTIFNRRDIDPSLLTWDAKLPFELALKTAPVHKIAEAYGLTKEDLTELSYNPAFIKAYDDAVKEVAKNGASFRLKAALQAEELLATSWELIHNPGTMSSVKADLIKSTVRWAGYEPKTNEGTVGAAFQINLNLG